MDVFNEFTGLRSDGRLPSEIRLVDAELAVIPDCTGSALLKMGQTEVLAQVRGPSESRGNNREAEINIRVKFADFAKLPHITRNRERWRDYEIFIKRTFESTIRRVLYPNSRIDISVTVLQDDGGVEAVAINTVTLAIIDAGIPIVDFVVALSAAWIDNRAFLDTGRLESDIHFPVLTMALFPGARKIVSMEMKSRMSVEAIKELTDATIEGCCALHTILAEKARVLSLKRASRIQL